MDCHLNAYLRKQAGLSSIALLFQDLIDLRAQSTGLMTSIPKPQGTHKIFESDEERDHPALASLVLIEQKLQQNNGSQPAEQQAPPEQILDEENVVLEANAEDVAKHTRILPSSDDVLGKNSEASI